MKLKSAQNSNPSIMMGDFNINFHLVEDNQVLEEYDCIDKVRQTNYYFDTEDFILTQDKLTMKLK